MNLLSRRSVIAVAAVVDVALRARPTPVAAKALAARLGLPPRHLETLLQALVRANILKGVRGPRGGYELARERRRLGVGDILRALPAGGPEEGEERASPLVARVLEPMLSEASDAFLAALDKVTIEDLCLRAERENVIGDKADSGDFAI